MLPSKHSHTSKKQSLPAKSVQVLSSGDDVSYGFHFQHSTKKFMALDFLNFLIPECLLTQRHSQSLAAWPLTFLTFVKMMWNGNRVTNIMGSRVAILMPDCENMARDFFCCNLITVTSKQGFSLIKCSLVHFFLTFFFLIPSPTHCYPVSGMVTFCRCIWFALCWKCMGTNCAKWIKQCKSCKCNMT